jgi:hypothetical protein
MADSVDHEVRVDAHPDLTTGIPRIHDVVEVVAADVWRELGLPSRPRVEVQRSAEHLPVTVAVDGERLPLSARRTLTLTWAAAGRPYQFGAADAHRWLDLIADRGPRQRVTALAWLVEATLKAALSRLVKWDQDILLPQAVSTAYPMAAKGLTLAAELGLAPSQLPLNRVGTDMTPGVDDPWAWCELIADTASTHLAITIRLARATLRRITTGPQPLATALFTMPPNPNDRGILDALFLQHGIRAPTLSFEVTDAVPAEVVVFSFGGVGSLPVRLLPDGVEVIKPGRMTPPPADVLGYAVDPVYGGPWPVVTAATAERLGEPTSPERYGAARFLLRALLGELQCRLACCWHKESASSWWYAASRHWPVAADLSVQLDAVFRWLLADRATIQYADPISEGMARGLASGRRSVPDLVAEARLALHGGVLGPVPVEAEMVMIVPAADEVDMCLDGSSPWPLLDRHQGLQLDPRTQVLVVPTAARDRIQRLMRPLADVVLVMATEELSGVVVPPPRDLVDNTGGT